MSKILVIPDTHLKPKMFDLADKILSEHEIDYAVQLGDNVDDFYCYENEYRTHEARMEKFYREHPETVWLFGNHEISYLIGRTVTGNTVWGERMAQRYEKTFSPKFAHLDGKVVFSHAGIFRTFVERSGLADSKDAKELIEKINDLRFADFWEDDSPIWARPQARHFEVPTQLDGILQVVGHTPMKENTLEGSVLSVDVFSTSWGKKFGSEKMIIVDTETAEFDEI